VGIASMRERAAEVGGSFVIGPGPSGGTLVVADLPLTAP
jgi:signal transduction histidine kinase